METQKRATYLVISAFCAEGPGDAYEGDVVELNEYYGDAQEQIGRVRKLDVKEAAELRKKSADAKAKAAATRTSPAGQKTPA